MNALNPESQKLRLSNIILLVFLLTSCTPMEEGIKPTGTIPIETQSPPATKSLPTGTRLSTATQSIDNLIAIIEVSDPASITYDPASAAYAEFPDALKELAASNASTNDAASMLAYSLGFPRQDSILAAQEIISLGPDWASTLLPALIMYLSDQRPEHRMVSAIILSITHDKGSCSLGNIGPLLWDTDPYVRTSAALAIQGITGNELVSNIYVITPDNFTPNSVPADIPEGKIVGAARSWWTDHGSKVNWHPSYDLCDP